MVVRRQVQQQVVVRQFVQVVRLSVKLIHVHQVVILIRAVLMVVLQPTLVVVVRVVKVTHVLA